MNYSIKHLFVVLTPFQLKMMEQVFNDSIYDERALLFYTKHVKLDQVNFKGQRIQIEFKPFSFIALKKQALKTLNSYRKEITAIDLYVKQFIEKHDFEAEIQVIIGTDKDNFTQVLLNNLYNSRELEITLHAVEEGLGYYIRENRRDKLKAIMYRMFTPLLFGQKLLYHRQLGTDPRIDKLHVRLPDMIPQHQGLKGKSISQIAQHSIGAGHIGNGNKVLIFSFPNEDYDINSIEKSEIFKTLISKLQGKQIHVKPHPREATEVLHEFSDLQLLDKTRVGEDLDYFDYGCIINFSSSVIIDILARNYPAERIYTIAITPIRFSFFDKTNCLNLSDLKRYSFEDTSQL